MSLHSISDWWRRNRGVTAVIVYIILFLVVAIVVNAFFGTKVGKDFGELLQKYGAAAAIVAGAVWALYQYDESRYKWPRLVGKQSAEFIPFDDEHLICRVWVELENKGNTLVVLTKATMNVRQVLPIEGIEKDSEHCTLKLERLDGRWIWPCGVPLVLTEPGTFDVHVEPGEQDRIAFDVMIPTEWELIEVCTFLENRDEKLRGWKSITLHAVPVKFDYQCWKMQKGTEDATANTTTA